MAADWTTIASLATATGTMVLALATFSSVRSSNRSARLAERALSVRLRPLLMAGRLEDPPQKVRWGDDHIEKVEGSEAVVREVEGSHYLAFGVRNVGAGIAVLHSWQLAPADGSAEADQPDVSRFRRHTRDIYVASGDLGFWQAAIRDADDEFRVIAEDLIGKRQVFAIDIMYGDHEGGQHTVSRFSIAPFGDDRWMCAVVRHWHLDRDDPRADD